MFVSSCATPPKTVYINNGAQIAADSKPLGHDAAGQTCVQNVAGLGRYVAYCGTRSKRPSARLQTEPMPPGGLTALATDSAWRRALDNNFACDAPTPTQLTTGPALLLKCTRPINGFPQIALVAQVGTQAWLADGVPTASPVLERAIALNSGRISAADLGSVTESPGLAAERLADRATSAQDLDAFEIAMKRAARANQEGDYAAAEDAYRGTLELQRHLLGREAPETARTLALEALQVSDLHRFDQANAMLARAEAIAAPGGISDESALPWVWLYQGLNLLNQNKPGAALTQLRRAELAFLRIAPAATAATQVDDVLPLDKPTMAAVEGIVESERYQAVAYRMLGDNVQSRREALAAAASLGNANIHNLNLTARILRTQASVQGAAGLASQSLNTMLLAANQFGRALPGSRTYAETQLLLAAKLSADGQKEAAIAACREAQHVLVGATEGVSADRLAPCLTMLGTQADTGDQPAARDMFELAELAQGNTTSQLIALASVRLSESSSKVADLIRERDDANAALADLYANTEEVPAGSPQAADLARQIAAAEQNRDKLEEALQSASPNFSQISQRTVSAADLLRALRPGEAFADIVLGADAGWVFLLRDDQVYVQRIQGGASAIDPLVRRIRASVDHQAPDGGLLPFDTEAAATLYTNLFGGVSAPLAGATSLSVAPSGTLLSLPFGLLLTGPAKPDHLVDAPWLIRRMVVAHVPAPVNFVQLRHAAGHSRATKPWFGFGDFIPVSTAQAEASFPAANCRDSATLFASLQTLPGATKELDSARRQLGASPDDELLGRAFTTKRVQSTELRDYHVLHFATHALLQTDLACESEPALVASAAPGAPNAAGALLTASQVAGLKLDADAILLSACNTGGPGGSSPGESLSGLARSFFYAGARAMLVTHWDVNDQVASILVSATLNYAQQNPSLGMAGALAQAQRDLLAKSAARANRANLAHPFFWAPLALIGDGTSSLSEKNVAGERNIASSSYQPQ